MTHEMTPAKAEAGMVTIEAALRDLVARNGHERLDFGRTVIHSPWVDIDDGGKYYLPHFVAAKIEEVEDEATCLRVGYYTVDDMDADPWEDDEEFACDDIAAAAARVAEMLEGADDGEGWVERTLHLYGQTYTAADALDLDGEPAVVSHPDACVIVGPFRHDFADWIDRSDYMLPAWQRVEFADLTREQCEQIGLHYDDEVA